jgi:hypothetical protein
MVINASTRIGRSDIDIYYQYKMLSLVANFGLERKPLEVYRRLLDWFDTKHSPRTNSPDLVKNLSWDNPPSYKTVQRYLEKFRDNPPVPRDRIEDFHFPGAMESIGWRYARSALDCLKFYLSEYRYRPPVGLVQWFSRIIDSTRSDLSDPKTFNKKSIHLGLYAEVYWFRELSIAFRKPVTSSDSLLEHRLAWSFNGSDADPKVYEDMSREEGILPNESLILVDSVHKHLVTEMPILMDILPRSTNK